MLMSDRQSTDSHALAGRRNTKNRNTTPNRRGHRTRAVRNRGRVWFEFLLMRSHNTTTRPKVIPASACPPAWPQTLSKSYSRMHASIHALEFPRQTSRALFGRKLGIDAHTRAAHALLCAMWVKRLHLCWGVDKFLNAQTAT